MCLQLFANRACILLCFYSAYIQYSMCSQRLQTALLTGSAAKCFTVPATCRFYNAKRIHQHGDSDSYYFAWQYLNFSTCWFLTEQAAYYLQCLMPFDLWIYPAVSVPASDCASLPWHWQRKSASGWQCISASCRKFFCLLLTIFTVFCSLVSLQWPFSYCIIQKLVTITINLTYVFPVYVIYRNVYTVPMQIKLELKRWP